MLLILIILTDIEMVDFMKRVAALDEELTVEERNLISVAYKNVIGARRASWRIISSMESKEESSGDANIELTRQYRRKVCRREYISGPSQYYRVASQQA